jgi:hypothetical protein
MAEVPCPSCRSALKAPDGAAGRRVRCKRCGHRFVAPGEGPEIEIADEPPADPFGFAEPTIHLDQHHPHDRPRRRRVERAGRKLPLALALLGGALTFALGGAATAGYFLLVRERPAVAAAAVSQARPPDAPKPAEEINPARDRDRPTDQVARSRDKTRPVSLSATAPVAVTALAAAFPLPDPPKGPTELIAKPKDRLILDCPAAVRAVRFAHGNPPVAAVLWNSFGGFQGSGATDAVDLYALPTGRRVERVEFPADGFAGPRLFELSPDGNRVAIEQPAGKLTVYDFEAKAKLLDGADPFAGADGPAGPPAAVRFVAPDRLAVFDRGGGLAVWDLKEKKRVLAGPPFGPNAAAEPPAAVSGVVNGRVLVAAAGSVTAVSLSTGKPDGPPVPLPDPRATAVAVAADALGKRAAVVCKQPGEAGFALAVLDLRGGGPAVHALLPTGAGPAAGVSFTGAETVVLVRTDGGAGGVLYDSEERVPVGYLRAASGPAAQFPDPSAGRHWWAVPDPADGKRSVLVAVEMPFEGYFGAAAKAAADRRPAFLVLRPDGLGK